MFPPGKLPAEALASLLSRHATSDARVLIGPGIGADAAAIEFGDRVLVVKSDPITFPTPDAGGYLVNVNANDIACMGAEPRWLLVTALLPERSTNLPLVESIFDGIAGACRPLGITLVGGHTEITLGLDRPILVGTLLGETDQSRLLDLRSGRPGDAILLANGIAIEGTAILAQHADRSALRGLPNELMQRAAAFTTFPGISVVRAAQALSSSGCVVRGMHDPTEGGLATALRELATITGCGIVVDEPAIPVYPETAAICAALELDPLGLIASGAPLAVIHQADADAALDALANAGVPAAQIGRLTPNVDERVLTGQSGDRSLPRFETDEIARYFGAA
jgi:hydrogenase maturation factor